MKARELAFTAKQMDSAINKAWAAAREETYLEAAKIADSTNLNVHPDCGRTIARCLIAKAKESDR